MIEDDDKSEKIFNNEILSVNVVSSNSTKVKNIKTTSEKRVKVQTKNNTSCDKRLKFNHRINKKDEI